MSRRIVLALLISLIAVSTSQAKNGFMSRAMMASNTACDEISGSWNQETANLAAYWKLNESVGVTSIADSAGAVNGTAASSVVMGSEGRLKTAATFDNTTDSYISFGNASALKLQFPFTISAWIKPASLTKKWAIVAVYDPVTYGKYQGYSVIVESNGSVSSNVGTGNSGGTNCAGGGRRDFKTPGGVITAGQWHHVVVVYNSITDREFYINGARQVGVADTSSGSTLRYPTNVEARIGYVFNGIGGTCASGNDKFDGQIDDVAIWNVALSELKAKTLYSQQSCGKN